jgi:hypothetical protein
VSSSHIFDYTQCYGFFTFYCLFTQLHTEFLLWHESSPLSTSRISLCCWSMWPCVPYKLLLYMCWVWLICAIYSICTRTSLQQSDAEWLTLGHSKGHSKGVLAPGESHIITLYLNRYISYMHTDRWRAAAVHVHRLWLFNCVEYWCLRCTGESSSAQLYCNNVRAPWWLITR